MPKPRAPGPAVPNVQSEVKPVHAPDKGKTQAYRDYAEELRAIAGHMECEESRRSLLRTADDFEQSLLQTIGQLGPAKH